MDLNSFFLYLESYATHDEITCFMLYSMFRLDEPYNIGIANILSFFLNYAVDNANKNMENVRQMCDNRNHLIGLQTQFYQKT